MLLLAHLKSCKPPCWWAVLCHDIIIKSCCWAPYHSTGPLVPTIRYWSQTSSKKVQPSIIIQSTSTSSYFHNAQCMLHVGRPLQWSANMLGRSYVSHVSFCATAYRAVNIILYICDPFYTNCSANMWQRCVIATVIVKSVEAFSYLPKSLLNIRSLLPTPTVFV